jgi:hypothetical protein
LNEKERVGIHISLNQKCLNTKRPLFEFEFIELASYQLYSDNRRKKQGKTPIDMMAKNMIKY